MAFQFGKLPANFHVVFVDIKLIEFRKLGGELQMNDNVSNTKESSGSMEIPINILINLCNLLHSIGIQGNIKCLMSHSIIWKDRDIEMN